jgi:hypothetical protein
MAYMETHLEQFQVAMPTTLIIQIKLVHVIHFPVTWTILPSLKIMEGS